MEDNTQSPLLETEVPIPLESETAQAQQENAVLEATSAGAREPFVKSSKYSSENYVIPGTPENVEFLTTLSTTPIGTRLAKHADAALSQQAGLPARQKKYEQLRQGQSTAMAVGGSEAALGTYIGTLGQYEGKPPAVHPYAGWLLQFGEDKGRILSNVVDARDKTDAYTKSYIDRGIDDLIRRNGVGILGDPKRLAEQMDLEGYFDYETDTQTGKKSSKEKEYFLRHAGNKYSSHYGISPFDWIKARHPEFEDPDAIGGFIQELINGRSLDPDNPKDRADLRKYREWAASNPTSWSENFANGANAFIGGVLDTLVETSDSLVNNKINWSDEWNGDKVVGGRLEKKMRFEAMIQKMRELHSQGFLINDQVSKLRKFEKAGGEDGPDMAIIDPTVASLEINPLLHEFQVLYRELDNSGAFVKDINGITGALSNLDAALQGTLGISRLFMSTDPDSVVTGIYTNVVGGFGYVTGQNRKKEAFAEYKERILMHYLNGSTGTAHQFESWESNGLIVGGRLYDKTIGVEAAKWEDINLYSSLLRNAFGMVKGGVDKYFLKGKWSALDEMEENAKAQQIVNKNRAKVVSEIRDLSRKGIELPKDVQDFIDVIKKQAVQAGETIDDYEALNRAFNGKPVLLDVKTGGLIPATAVQLKNVVDTINTQYASVQKVRDELARVAWQGKNFKYSKAVTSAIDRARTYLESIEPGAWADAPAGDIYERIRRGNIPEKYTDAAGKEIKLISAYEKSNLVDEVGRTWRSIDFKGLKGYKQNNKLPVQFGIFYDNPLTNGVLAMLDAADARADNWFAISSKHFQQQTAIEATVRQLQGGRTIQTITSQGNNLYAQYLKAKALPLVAKGLGIVSDVGNVAREYLLASGGPMPKYNSVLLSMYEDYNKRLAGLAKELQLLSPTNKTVNYSKRWAEIHSEMQTLQSKAGVVKGLHAWGADGILDNATTFWNNGVVGAIMPDVMIGLSDSNAWGTGAGYHFAGSGQTLINRSFTRNFSSKETLKERTNFDLTELHSRLLDKSPEQQQAALEILQSEYTRSMELYAKDKNAGILYWGRAVATMVNLHRGANNFELVGGGVIDGINALHRHADLFENQETFNAYRNALIQHAEKYGFTADEARTFADKQIQQRADYNASKVRQGNIEKEIDFLVTEKGKLHDGVEKSLRELEEAAKIIAKDAGLDFSTFSTDYSGLPVAPDPKTYQLQITGADGSPIIDPATGKPVVNQPEVDRLKADLKKYKEDSDRFQSVENDVAIIDGVRVHRDTGEPLSEAVFNKINAFKEQYLQVRMARRDTVGRITAITEKLQELVNEKHQIDTMRPEKAFRDGEVYFDPVANARISSVKKGVTIFEVMDENGEEVVKTTIYIDKEIYSQATAREELAHALTLLQSTNEARTRLTVMTLGEWKRNQFTGEFEMSVPPIAGTLEASLNHLDMFSEWYASTLSDSEAIEWQAKWEIGKRQFKENKDSVRNLQPLLLELYGKIIEQRLQVNHPHLARGDWTPSSVTGSMEGSPNPNAPAPILGSTRARLGSKFVFGNLTVADLVNNGNPLLLSDIRTMLNLDENVSDVDAFEQQVARLPNAARASMEVRQREFIGACNVVRMFARGGFLDKMIQKNILDNLEAIGFSNDNNNSGDPARFWKQGEILDENGLPTPIHPSYRATADMLLATSRQRAGEISTDVFPSEADIIAEQGNADDASISRRIMFAYASGRRRNINNRGQFVNKQGKPCTFADIQVEESAPIALALRHIALQTDSGEKYGIKLLKASKKEGTPSEVIMMGCPTKDQYQALKELLKSQETEGNLNERTVEVMDLFFASIADGNPFDPKATNPGMARWFVGEYQKVFEGKDWSMRYGGMQLYGSRSQRVKGGLKPEIRTFAPFAVVIEDSGLDALGNKLEQEVWDPETNTMKKVKGGYKVPTLYFWCIDGDAKVKRTNDAWAGTLKDENGKKYWSNDDMIAMFGTRQRMHEAIDVYMRNISTGGDMFDTNASHHGTPAKRSWEALLEARDSNGDLFVNDEATALAMADTLNRVVGFHQTKGMRIWSEITAAETKLLDKKVKNKDQIKRDIAELKKKLADTTSQSERDEIMGQLYAENPHQGDLSNTPLWATNTIFTKIRPDRFTDVPMNRVSQNSNYGLTPMTHFGMAWGQVNFSSTNWLKMEAKDVSQVSAQHKMAGAHILEGVWHPSGYKGYNVRERIQDGPKKGQWAPGGAKWVVFDPNGNVLDGRFGSSKDAFVAAQEHSGKNPGKAQAGNAIERELSTVGWLPRGMAMDKFGTRLEFLSPDGAWSLKRRDNGKYSLVHIESDITAADDISISTGIGKKKEGNVKQLLVAMQYAIENDVVEVGLQDLRVQELRTEGIADRSLLRRIDDPLNPGKKKTTVKFSKNIAFWDFMRHVKDLAGYDEMGAVRELMIKELGEDVLDNDHSVPVGEELKNARDNPQGFVPTAHGKTIKWIEDWVSKKNWDFLEGFKQFEVDESNVHAESVKYWLARQGRPVPARTAPRKPIITDSDTKDSRDKKLADWALQIREFNDGAKAAEAARLKETQVSEFMMWVSMLRKEQNRYNLSSGYTPETKGVAVPTANNVPSFEGEQVVNKLATIRNSAREGAVSMSAGLWSNDLGWVVQHMMWKDEKPSLGWTIKTPSVNIGFDASDFGWVKSLENARSQAAGTSKPFPSWMKKFGAKSFGNISKAEFIVYSPGGAIAARFETLEEANKYVVKASNTQGDALLKAKELFIKKNGSK